VSVRRAALTLSRGWLTADAGKQFIRWGKTDIVTPTDRLAPRDFLNVIDNELLGVTGVRAAAQLRRETLEIVWLPRFTPSRLPLRDDRWAVLANGALPFADEALPTGSQTGIRWAHVGDRLEFAASVFDGSNHLPNFDIVTVPGPVPSLPVVLAVRRTYPSIRSYGGDAALPTPWLTLKMEAAVFTSPPADADDYVLYVVQVERQTGEWIVVGGYAGEVVTARRSALTFAPDRGLTRSLVARASYTIDPNRTVGIEGAVRQNARGAYVKLEYSQSRGQHWRATMSGVALAGASDDFLGQYRRNSHVLVGVRYSY
jgi:hypothetical protein